MNTIYLNGIYQAKSENLIKIESINNLDKLSLINYLRNLNYGNGSSYHSLDNILATELKNIRLELNELSGSFLLGDIFYLDEDLINIKIVFKSVYYNIDIENYNLVSRFEKTALIEFFKNNNDAFINIDDIELFLKIKDVQGANLKEKLENIELLYYNHIYNVTKNKFPFLIEYLETKNFNKNFLTFLKLRNRKDSINNLKPLLVKQNNFDKAMWLELYELSDDVILERLNSVYFGLITESLKTFFETKNITDLKVVLNERLTEQSLNLSFDLNNVGGVIHFLHLKQKEINSLRWLYYANK